jgi:mannose-6-phosphate isomerase-like protein (cupin superfamily)
MRKRKEANKQAMKEDRHKEDQEFNNDLLAIAHNASFHLHHGVRSKHFFLLQTFFSCTIGLYLLVGLV